MADIDLPSDDATIEALLRDRRFGPPDPNEATPWDFVRRWPDAALRARVWPIISRLLTDDDELVRARAVEFVRVWDDSSAWTLPRLLEIARRRPELFADQEPEGVTLRHELGFALSNRADVAHGAEVASVLRTLSTDRPLDSGATLLGRYEPAFVASQARRWGDSAAGWLEEATRSVALCRRDDVVSFLNELRTLRTDTRERVLAAVESYIRRDDAAAAAIAKSLGLAPPKTAAPTPDECRRAIGL